MSRSYCSYDEDWQRRKSVLIRSLFHDIPILSPVLEESNGSNQYAPTQEVFASPPRPYSPLPPLIIERVPVTNKHDEPEEYYEKLHRKIKKIYQKLFVENRNLFSLDYEPNYSDSSGYEDNVIDSGSIENIDLHFLESISPGKRNTVSMIQDREATESSEAIEEEKKREDSTKSNEADCESTDTEIIDIVNYTASNQEESMRSEHEESVDNINEDDIRNKEFDYVESNKRTTYDQESRKEEEFNHSSKGDQEMTESEELNETEDGQSNEKDESLASNFGKRKIIEKLSETVTEGRKRMRKEQEHSIEERESNSSIDTHKLTESEESKIEDECEEEESTNRSIDEHKISNKTESNQEEASKQSTTEHEITRSEVSNETGTDEPGSAKEVVQLEDCEKTASEDEDEKITSNDQMMEEDGETSDTSGGPQYEQITTAALVHFDGLQDAEEKESRVSEDSVRSVILPTRFRRAAFNRHLEIDERIEVLSVLEEKADPKLVPTFDADDTDTTEEDIDEEGTPQTDATDENINEEERPHTDATEEEAGQNRTEQPGALEEINVIGTARANASSKNVIELRSPQHNTTDEDIEEMRSNQPNFSQGSIAVSHRSDSASTSDRTALPQVPTALTSSSQDGGENRMSEFKISDDMNDILNSIFNESRNEDKRPSTGTKRKLYVDKSIQAVETSRVTWDEMRSNFFIGTPKIFRLCACTDHVCH